MKTRVHGFAAIALVTVTVGCTTPEGHPDRTAGGALMGGALGAVAGAILARGDPGAGALIGGSLGAITGGLIGNALDQQEREILARQSPATLQRVDEGRPLYVADVKELARAGVSDEVIISQIRNSRTRYQLSAQEIIDLKNAGVSERVIDFMINTGAASYPAERTVLFAPEPPPPPPPETILVAPGPGCVWVKGEWVWRGRWVWSPGYWCRPPYPGAIWISGRWERGPDGWHYRGGRWRR